MDPILVHSLWMLAAGLVLLFLRAVQRRLGGSG